MSVHPIRLQIPFADTSLVFGFDADAERDVRLLLRFARARASHGAGGFWLEYGWDTGESQMVWIDPAHMPTARFDVTATPVADQGREDDMSRHLARTHHVYLTAKGWQSDTHEFAVDN